MSATSGPGGVPRLPVVFRPLATRIVLLVTGAAVFAVLTVVAVLLPARGAASWHAADRVAISAGGLLIWAVLALLSRPRVAADRQGLTVTNLTTRRHLAWEQIVRVSLRPGDPWVTLDLSDGTTLAVMAIQPALARRRAVADAGILRALTEAYGTAPPPDGPASG